LALSGCGPTGPAASGSPRIDDPSPLIDDHPVASSGCAVELDDGEALIGVRPAPPGVDFYGPATVRDNRLYLHLVALPIENVVVRGIPVRRVRRVSLIGRKEPLHYRLPLAAYDDHLTGSDVSAELIIDAPVPSGALIDVIAIEFEGPV